MRVDLGEWAVRHRVSEVALTELRELMRGELFELKFNEASGSGETKIQTELRVLASKRGWRLWRNNRGCGKLDSGNFVRFGLANDSPAVNHVLKSSDLIGIRPVYITPAHVGQTLGQFASIEVKQSGWKFNANTHEVAQLAWINLVNGLGGYAKFSTGDL